MQSIHCPYCSQDTKVNASGRVVPHRIGTERCVGSGMLGEQMWKLSRRLEKAMPGSKLAERFKSR